MKELNVIGTMQLLAACQKAPSLRHLVVKSTTTVYGASSRDPAMFTEDMEPRRAPARATPRTSRRSRATSAARRRPRRPRRPAAANVIGPHVTSPITSYFRLPVIPTVLGHDPRLQFLHEQDLLAVLQHAALTGVAGTYNVAGDGVLMLSQAIRRLKRPSVPLPPSRSDLGSALRSARLADFSPEQLSFLTYGRGVDTTRMRSMLDFHPTFTTAEAFADFGSRLPPTGGRTEKPRQPGGRALPPVP